MQKVRAKLVDDGGKYLQDLEVGKCPWVGHRDLTIKEKTDTLTVKVENFSHQSTSL